MRRWMWMAVLAAGVAPLALNGCTQGVNDEAPLLAAASSPVADVPVPKGFYMTSESRSSVAQGGAIRLVEHYYKGDGGLLPVVRFYREQLPGKGWAVESQEQVGNRVTLNGSKGKEDLVITIWEGTFDTHVEVRIFPTDRGVTAK